MVETRPLSLRHFSSARSGTGFASPKLNFEVFRTQLIRDIADLSIRYEEELLGCTVPNSQPSNLFLRNPADRLGLPDRDPILDLTLRVRVRIPLA